MKKIWLAVCILMLPAILAAQTLDEMDDFDAIFADAEDTEDAVVSEPEQKSTFIQTVFQTVSFFGSLDASLGWAQKVSPSEAHSPYAALDSVFGFTARPSEVLTVKGSLYTNFPHFAINLYTLYFDYILFGRYYLTAGRYKTSWGNSVIFDTNILDDEAAETQDVLNPDKYSSAKEFSAVVTIPLGAGNIQALASYNGVDSSIGFSPYTWYAAAVEYPLFGTSFKVFGRSWASADTTQMDPAVGLEITRDISEFHFYAHGAVHCPVDAIRLSNVSYTKVVAGMGRKWEQPNIAFVFEYECLSKKNTDEKRTVSHEIALQARWSGLAGGHVTPGVKWYHTITDKKGEVLPGISISGLPHATIDIAVPILYGGYRDSTYSALYADDERTPVIIGAKLSLSVSW